MSWRRAKSAAYSCADVFYGARGAEPGEFTKRAFLNGRIDLIQAESVMDIINARSAAALKMAVRQQEGFCPANLKIYDRN